MLKSQACFYNVFTHFTQSLPIQESSISTSAVNDEVLPPCLVVLKQTVLLQYKRNSVLISDDILSQTKRT